MSRVATERASRAAAVQSVSVQRERPADRAVQLSERHLSQARRRPEQNLTVEGGNDQTRYYVSGNFSNEDGILRSTSSRRTGARVNLQQQLTPKLIGNVTANYITTQQPGPGVRRAERLRDHGLAVLRADERRLPAGERHLSAAPVARHEPAARDRSHSQPADDRSLHRFDEADLHAGDESAARLHDRHRQRRASSSGQFVPRDAVFGTAPLATGRSQSVFQSTRVVNQDGVGTLHLEADGRRSSCGRPPASTTRRSAFAPRRRSRTASRRSAIS